MSILKNKNFEDKMLVAEQFISDAVVWKLFDYVVIPLCILFLLFDPNYKHGYIDHFEAGQYLSWVNYVFNGKIPYKDFFVLHGPLHIYNIAFIMLLFGKSLAVLRTLFYCNYIISFLIIYITSRIVCKYRYFSNLITFICLLEVSQPFWAPRWDYGRMGIGLLVMLLLFSFLRYEKPGFVYAAGALSCVALFYSLDIGVCVIIASTVCLVGGAFAHPDKKLNAVMICLARNAVRYTVAFLFVIVPLVLFIFRHGFLAYLQTSFSVFQYHLKAWSHPLSNLINEDSTKLGLEFFLTETFKALYLPKMIYGAVSIYLIYCLVRSKWNIDKVVALVLLTYGLLLYKASFRSIEGPQFQVALPPLIMLAGMSLEKMFDYLLDIYYKLKNEKILRTASVTACILISAIFIASAFYLVASHKRYYDSFGKWLRYQAVKDRFIATYDYPISKSKENLAESSLKRIGNMLIPAWEAKKMEKVVDYLDKHTGPDEEVFAFPDLGIYNFLADRPAFGRFSMPVFAWAVPEWRKKLIAELMAKRPRIIIYCTTISNMASGIGRREEVLPEVVEFIKNDYHVIEKIGDILICERNVQVKQ